MAGLVTERESRGRDKKRKKSTVITIESVASPAIEEQEREDSKSAGWMRERKSFEDQGDKADAPSSFDHEAPAKKRNRETDAASLLREPRQVFSFF